MKNKVSLTEDTSNQSVFINKDEVTEVYKVISFVTEFNKLISHEDKENFNNIITEIEQIESNDIKHIIVEDNRIAIELRNGYVYIIHLKKQEKASDEK